jgi:hypothetical protein
MGAGFAHGESLLVLAGPKGAGKTTLLTDALSSKAPLFGASVDDCFQATRLPGAGKEFRMPAAEIVERRTWACNAHLAHLAQRTPPLTHLVVHLDIMDFCRFNARPFESLLDPGENYAEMLRNPAAAIFACYRQAHLATLSTPYERCADWYKARAIAWEKPLSPNDERLYSGAAQGRAAFAAVGEAWLMFAASLANVAAHWRIAYDSQTVSIAPLASDLSAWREVSREHVEPKHDANFGVRVLERA